MDFELNTPKEIWEAKKTLYESDSATKKSFISSIVTLVLLVLLLLMNVLGNQDSWDCDANTTGSNKNLSYYCTETRSQINCKTVSGPLKAQIYINFDEKTKASAEMTCPWELAVSELRLCFTLLSCFSIGLALTGLKKESKKKAELAYQTGMFLSILLLIQSYFDYLSINNSETNNHNFCTLQDEFVLKDGMTGKIECGFTFYNITVFIEFLGAFALFYSSQQINKWKANFVSDHI